ncbi:MAG: ABC transporter substrate-binding protein [Acidimicrobiia bacterium]|nr:ABC transporter substrate-binding protein [Acidimicrobiia bacterium]
MRTRQSRLSLTIIAVALSMIAAACTTSEDTADTTAPAAVTTAADTETTTAATEATEPAADTTEPAPSGDVTNPGLYVHAADDEPLSLDPAGVAAGEAGETVILQVYERLVEIGPGGPDLVPGLSTDVPTVDNGLISEDGLTYTFPIRDGVVFHDGSALSADVVKFNWDRVLTMDLPEGNGSIIADLVDSTSVDGNNFVVTLNERNAAFLNSVVTAAVASIVSQDAVEANGGVVAGQPNDFFTGNAVGSGAYRLTAWNRGETIELEVFEDYWGEPANLDVRIQQVPDSDVRVLGLRAGDFDSIETDPTFVTDLEGADGVTIFQEGWLLEPVHIGLNLDIQEDLLPPEDTVPADFFWDPRVRQAFNYAFNYENFIQGGLSGLGGTVPHYLPQGMLAYDDSLVRYATDLARAEELFRETGWWDEGFTMTVLVEEGGIFETAGLVLKDSMAALNPSFVVNVAAVVEVQFDDAHAQVPFEYAAWIKNADPFADPAALFAAYEHPDGEWGSVHKFRNGYQDADGIAALIDEAAVSIDTERRIEIYQELTQLLFDDPMWVLAGNERALMAHRDWVQNFQMNPLWPRPSLKFALFNK